MLAKAKALFSKAGSLAFSLASFTALRVLFILHDFRRPIAISLEMAWDFLCGVRRRLLHITLSFAIGVVTATAFLALASILLFFSWSALTSLVSFIPWWALLVLLAFPTLYASVLVGAWTALAAFILPFARPR